MELLHSVKMYPYSELSFFEEASIEIMQCRQVLKWTYAVIYLEETGMDVAEKELFKFQQTALEEACERTH